MKVNSKIMKIQSLSILLLIIYCFGSTSLFIFHEHDNHHHELSYCEGAIKLSNKHIACTHKAHLANVKESCFLCDHCTIGDHTLLVNTIDFNIKLVFANKNPLIAALYLLDSTNTLNKSPPFIFFIV